MEGGTIYRRAFAITPSNTTKLSPQPYALYVGGAGDLTVVMADSDSDEPVKFDSVPAGTILPIHVRQVRSTGTGATEIVGLL